MGTSSSKTAKVVGAAARKYPNRPSGTAQAQAPPTATQASTTNAVPQSSPPADHRPGPRVKPQVYASGDRSEAINLDASDPDFAQSLRSIGPVQPNPTLSPTSAFTPQQGGARPNAPDPRSNPAITVLEARARFQEAADAEAEEVGIRGHHGRQFLDIHTIRQMIIMREQGTKHSEIERRLGLKEGAVARLGTAGVVELVQEQGRAEKEMRMV